MLPPGEKTTNLENRIKDKTANFVYLKKDIDEIEQDLELGKIKSNKQIRTLEFIIQNGDVLISELEIFADTTRAVINTLCKNGYLKIIEKQVERNPFENKVIEKTSKLKLNEEQNKAYEAICAAMEDMMFSEFLIFGVTGSR